MQKGIDVFMSGGNYLFEFTYNEVVLHKKKNKLKHIEKQKEKIMKHQVDKKRKNDCLFPEHI